MKFLISWEQDYVVSRGFCLLNWGINWIYDIKEKDIICSKGHRGRVWYAAAHNQDTAISRWREAYHIHWSDPSGKRLDGEVWLVTRTFPAHAWYTKYVQYNNYGPLEVEGPQLLVLSICQLVLLSGNIVPEDMYSVSSSMSQYLGYLDNSSSMMPHRCQIWGISRMWLIWGRGRRSGC